MNEQDTGESMGAKALMFAMIAGAALLFLEVTWSQPVQPTEHPVARTVTVQPAEAIARS